MRLSPRLWFLIPSSKSESSRFKVQIQNKRCKRKVEVEHIKIFVCKDADFVDDLISCQIDWELEYFLSLSRNHTCWEEANSFEIIHPVDDQDCLVLKIPRDNSVKKDRIHMFSLENDEYHIIDINEIHDGLLCFNLANCLVELNTNLIRNFLLKGLNNIEIYGTPGQIHCFGERSIGLLGGQNSSKGSFGWCSGISLYGDGAILSFSHESFLLGKGGQRAVKVILENFFKFKHEIRREKRIAFIGFSDCDSLNFICNVSDDGFVYSKSSLFESVELNSIENCINSHELDILVINGNKEEKKPTHETELSSRILERFISSGKLLIIGLCPWGWEYISGGRLDSHSISNNINKEMGMVLTDEYFNNEGGYIGIQNQTNYFLSTFHYWRKLILSIDGIYYDNKLRTEEYLLMTKDIECHLKKGAKTNEQNKILDLIAQLLKKKIYLKLKPPFNMEYGINILFMAIARSRLLEDQLSEICCSEDERYKFDDFDTWINMNQFWKVEDDVSGLYSSELNIKELNLSINEAFCPVYDIPLEWQNTGVYIKYKNVLGIEFVPNNQYSSFSFKSKIHIGSHSDFLRYKETEILKRLPLISKTYNWHIQESNYITIESPCEGIVYFEYISGIGPSNTSEPNALPNRNKSCNFLIGVIKFTPLTEGDVALTPIYTIDKTQINSCSKDNRVVITDLDFLARFFSKDNNKLSSLLPAWIELHGRKIVITIPTRVLYRMNCLIIDDLLEFWDKVVDTQNELYFNCKWTKERIVCDIQISDGYMHSGKFFPLSMFTIYLICRVSNNDTPRHG